jgi:hypothetical protein
MTRLVLFTLLGVVAAAAAVLSFAALRDLGLACGFSPQLAWLLPLVIDAGAAAGSVTWLSNPPPAARIFGRKLALVLLAASVIGNGIAHLLEEYHLSTPWWLVVAVSGLAPAVLASVVHLTVLAVQGHTEPPVVAEETPAEQAVDEDTPDRVAELLAEGIGRRRLSRELGVTEHQAREILTARRNGNGVHQ